jgi:thiol-disulfide isomerase/thioredoxin
MMKTNLKIGILAVIVSCFMVGCDEIDQPIIESGTYRSDLYGPAPEFTPEGTPHQRVLLEDFTGHDCGNCPNGHVAAANLQETYAADLAVVAIHAGSLAQPLAPDFPDDWTTEEGEYYLLTQVGQDIMPKGRINRLPGASTIFSPSAWSAKVDEASAQTAAMNLQVQADYQAANQHWNVHVFSEWFQNLSGDYRLVVLLTESGIVAPQLWYGNDPEYIEEYDHEHMLRASGTGATGLVVATNPQQGETATDSYTFNWNSAWNPDSCEVVAFITEGDNGRVLNVAKTKLVE